MKIAINVVLVLIVLFVACTGIALAEEEKANPTLEEKMAELLDYYNAQEEAKKQVKFTSGEDVKDLAAVKSNKNVIEARGKMPIVDTELKKQVMFERYDEIGQSTKEEIIEKYGYPNGTVIGQGYDCNGYVSLLILTGSDVDEKTLNSLYEIIEEESGKRGIKNVPVVFEYEEIPTEEVSRSDYIRPMVGGIRVERSNGIGSTLNAPAKDSSGTKVTLISGHSAVNAGGIGEYMWQSDSSNLFHRIGVIDDIGGTEADVASVSWSNIDEKVYTSSTQSNWEPIVAWRNPWANGTSISKSGIETGVTTGNVVAKYLWKSSSTFGTLYNQVRANYSSSDGDSGSPVYYMNNGHLELLGIHWGKTSLYTYFSPISGIMADLDVLPALETTYPKGDFDYDNDVDFDDFVEFAASYDNGLYYNSNGDFDDDGGVDFDDFVEFAAVYTP